MNFSIHLSNFPNVFPYRFLLDSFFFLNLKSHKNFAKWKRELESILLIIVSDEDGNVEVNRTKAMNGRWKMENRTDERIVASSGRMGWIRSNGFLMQEWLEIPYASMIQIYKMKCRATNVNRKRLHAEGNEPTTTNLHRNTDEKNMYERTVS